MKRPNFRSLFRFSVFLLGIFSILATWWFHPATAQINRNADQVLSAVYDSTNTAINVEFPSASSDPCLNPRVAKSSVVININAATTAELVPLASGQTVYACASSFSYSVAGGVQFKYGTGVNCGTGQTNLTGSVVTTVNEFLSFGWGGTMFKTAASNALCVSTAGTAPSMQGVLTYVQQ